MGPRARHRYASQSVCRASLWQHAWNAGGEVDSRPTCRSILGFNRLLGYFVYGGVTACIISFAVVGGKRAMYRAVQPEKVRTLKPIAGSALCEQPREQL